MLPGYEDIYELAGDRQPSWFDEVGVPRFCNFHPKYLHNPYATEGVLLEIACKECERHFLVAQSYSVAIAATAAKNGLRDWRLHGFRWAISNRDYIEYGDPPFHSDQSCGSGSSQRSFTLRIVECWYKDRLEWCRNQKSEISYPELQKQREQEWKEIYGGYKKDAGD